MTGARLVIEDAAGTRSVVPFGDDAIVVGRGPEGVAVRLGERDVSRRHARFGRASGGVFVEDLGSRNGTRVNGERITGRRRLRDGDLVQIGDYDLAVLAEAAATAGPGAPPPLPAPARDPNAVTMRLPLPPEVEAGAELGVPPARPPTPRRRTLAVAIVAGLVALAVGVAAGFAVGTLTAPAPPAVTRP